MANKNFSTSVGDDWIRVASGAFARSPACPQATTVGSSGSITAIRGSSSGKFAAFNGVTSAELAVSAGVWLRVFCQLANSAAADRLRIGAADTGTGASFGNSASAAGTFLMVGAAFSAMSLCYAFDALGAPSAGQIAGLDAWAADRFGGTLLL